MQHVDLAEIIHCHESLHVKTSGFRQGSLQRFWLHLPSGKLTVSLLLKMAIKIVSLPGRVRRIGNKNGAIDGVFATVFHLARGLPRKPRFLIRGEGSLLLATTDGARLATSPEMSSRIVNQKGWTGYLDVLSLEEKQIERKAKLVNFKYIYIYVNVQPGSLNHPCPAPAQKGIASSCWRSVLPDYPSSCTLHTSFEDPTRCPQRYGCCVKPCSQEGALMDNAY